MNCIDCGTWVEKKRVRRCEKCETQRRTKNCKYCKNSFIDTTSKINKKFCSRECVNNNSIGKKSPKRKGVDVKCKMCDTFFYKRLNSTQECCSSKCFGLSKRGEERIKYGLIKKCNVCKEEYYVPKAREKSKFCSKKCADIGQQCKKIKKTCKICNIEFEVYPSREKQQLERGETIQYCSQECRDLDPNRKEMLIKMNEHQNNNKKLNKLELAGNTILNEIELDYEPQVLIGNKFLVDIFIVKYNIVIQWDGDYWHGHPSKLKNGIPDKRQKKRMDYDKSQDAYMRKMGITVLRFWEHNVYKNKGEIIDIIRNAIQSITN